MPSTWARLMSAGHIGRSLGVGLDEAGGGGASLFRRAIRVSLVWPAGLAWRLGTLVRGCSGTGDGMGSGAWIRSGLGRSMLGARVVGPEGVPHSGGLRARSRTYSASSWKSTRSRSGRILLIGKELWRCGARSGVWFDMMMTMRMW
jgi:hypothetical protein